MGYYRDKLGCPFFFQKFSEMQTVMQVVVVIMPFLFAVAMDGVLQGRVKSIPLFIYFVDLVVEVPYCIVHSDLIIQGDRVGINYPQ